MMKIFSREFLASGVAITGLVFSINGIVFSAVGAVLAMLIVPIMIGFALLVAGSGFLIAGFLLISLRAKTVNKRAQVLIAGLESSGVITEIVQNYHVRINRKRPWIVRYKFDVRGVWHEGSDSMMDLPSGYAPDARVIVAYDSTDARNNALKRLQ